MPAMRLGCSLAFIALAALRNTRAYRMDGEDGALHQEDSKLRDEMADKEEAWELGIKPGVAKMWIDDNFQVFKANNEVFFSDRSYIIMDKKGALHTIYLWPGKEATQTNQLRAKYKALDHLNRLLSIHEECKVMVEVPGAESADFLSLFSNRLEVRGPQESPDVEELRALQAPQAWVVEDGAKPWWDGPWLRQKGAVTSWWVDRYDRVHPADKSFQEDLSYIVLLTSEWSLGPERLQHTTYVWEGIDASVASRERAKAKVDELRQHLRDQFPGSPGSRGSMPEDNEIVDMTWGGSTDAQAFMYNFKGDHGPAVQIVRTSPPGTMWQVTATPATWEERHKQKWLLLQAPWKQSSFNPDDSFLLETENEVLMVSGENAGMLVKQPASTLVRHIRGWRGRARDRSAAFRGKEEDKATVNVGDFAKWAASNHVDIAA